MLQAREGEVAHWGEVRCRVFLAADHLTLLKLSRKARQGKIGFSGAAEAASRE